MSETEIILLSYPDVTPQNLTFLRAAAAHRNIRLREWEPHRVSIWCDNADIIPLYEDIPQSPSVIIHRTITRLQAIVIPALRLWEKGGSIIINDLSASVASRDKLATAMLLAEVDLPIVPNLAFLPWEQTVFDRLPSGVTVIKPAHGLQGRGVSFFNSRAEAESTARTMMWSDADDLVSEFYLAQPAIGRLGQDIRAYVVDGACVALARRTATDPREQRANITLGAAVSALALDHPAAALAVAATEALGLDYAGVDLIEAADGELRILEVDAWAGFAGLQAVTGADIAGAIIDLALGKLRGSSG